MIFLWGVPFRDTPFSFYTTLYMTRIFTCLLALFTFVSTISAQHIRDSITVGVDSREFYLHLPNGTAPTVPVPVVIAFHGMGDNANNFKGIGFSAIADTANFIAVYPQGLPMNMLIQTVNAWRIGTPFDGSIDDVAFASDLIDTLKTRYMVDTTRVYVTGFSMGGFMSQRLACELNTKVAAIASHSGTLAASTEATCASNHVIPMLHLHGTADQTIGYDGGGPFAAFYEYNSADSTAIFWAGFNECDASPDSTRLPDVKADGFTIDRFSYPDCKDSSEVLLYRINGADHQWMFSNSNDISSTLVIWDFFARHKMGEDEVQDTTGTGITGFTLKNSIKIYPNPTNGLFSIETSFPVEAGIEVYDALGQLVASQLITGVHAQVDIRSHNKGMYFVRITNATDGKIISQKRLILQ